MTRTLTVTALLVLPAVASAQIGAPSSVGPLMIGGREVTGSPIGDGTSAFYPVQTPVLPRFAVGGGSLGETPPLLVPSGAFGGTRYSRPYYPLLVAPEPAPAPNRNARPLVVVLSDEARATLAVQLPGVAEVWVDRKKLDGDPSADWTLTSPMLRVGDPHTFELKSRWTTGGKTFEASRTVTVAAGDRSRLIVVSGTEVK